MMKIYQEKVTSLHGPKSEYANLGEYLQATRINLGLDLEAVARETKISAKNIQAMEKNNFAALPAEAFARGLYTLYANALCLDGQEVLQMYMQQRPPHGKSGNLPTIPATKQAQEVGSMAERPTFLPFSFFGLILLLLLLFGGFLCWYFSWNPASYLSQKLRSLEDPQRIEQLSSNTPDQEIERQDFRTTQLPRPLSKHSRIFSLSYPTEATASVGEDRDKATQQHPEQGREYFTNAEFNEKPRNELSKHLLQ